MLCPPALLCRLAADLHPLLGPRAVQAAQAGGGALVHLVCNNDKEKCFFPHNFLSLFPRTPLESLLAVAPVSLAEAGVHLPHVIHAPLKKGRT